MPETIARFLQDSAPLAGLLLKEIKSLAHTFEPGTTPSALREYESKPNWRLPRLANRYPRLSTDRKVADANALEWITPGHALFEALRLHTWSVATEILSKGACFHWLDAMSPLRLDFYRARIVDGLGNVIHERMFVIQLEAGKAPVLREPGILGNLVPTKPPATLPTVAGVDEVTGWLNEHALRPFVDEVRQERSAEVERVLAHVNFSLTELIGREDQKIGKLSELAERGLEGAAGNLKQAEDRHAELLNRRERRRDDLARQATLSLQGVERMTSILVLPQPGPGAVEARRLRPSLETELTAMRIATEYEVAAGRTVTDVSEKDLGYDLTSLDTKSGELRLIEVKGIGADTGSVMLTPNELRVAQDRPECFWLYVVTNCDTTPVLFPPILNPAKLPWGEVMKVQHYAVTLRDLREAQE